jgi:sigma-E factor negative regulatory protein RseB
MESFHALCKEQWLIQGFLCSRLALKNSLTIFQGFWVLFIMGLCPLAVLADDSAQVWLERMQLAVDEINYQGTLVHMTPGHAEQFRVYHRVVGEDTTERLVLVDGEGAEIIRTRDEVICIFPNMQSVVVESRQTSHVSSGPLRANLPAFSEALLEHYELSSLADDRVAERSAVVIEISPRDQYRYGYRLWLDQETAMPLKSQLIGEDKSMPLEEIRFISISLPDQVSSEAVQSAIDTTSFHVARHQKAPRQRKDDGEVISWRAREVPPGFMLSVARFEYMEGDSNNPRMHLVYTDGLASVSVFMDIGVAASEQAEGLSMMGAASVFSVMNEGWLVTAMGEVPPRTVERIAVSMTADLAAFQQP